MFGITSPISSNALSMLGWFIVPSLATHYTQVLYYKITVPLGDASPLPGSPKYERHKRNIYAMIISLYLVYSVVEAVWNVTNSLSPESNKNSLYGALELDPEATASTIRSAFRRMSVKFHPDKATGSGPEVEERWLRIKSSYDMLSNPVLRFGYDRFGDAAIAWTKKFETAGASSEPTATVMSDFVMNGLRDTLGGFYGGTLLVLCVMYLFGIAKTGHVWRFFFLFIGGLVELMLITRSTPSLYATLPVMRWLKLTPYQLAKIVRNLILTSFIAINRLGPLISSGSDSHPLTTKKGIQHLQKQLETIDTLSTHLAYESTQMFVHQMVPMNHSAQLVAKVKTKLTEELVEKRLSEDLFMKDALSNLNTEILLTHANREAEVSRKTEPVRKRK